jgi:hypothetical protein
MVGVIRPSHSGHAFIIWSRGIGAHDVPWAPEFSRARNRGALCFAAEIF